MAQLELQSGLVEDEEQDTFEQGEAPTTYVEPVGLIAGGQVKQPRFLPREESVFAPENPGFLDKTVMKVSNAVLKVKGAVMQRRSELHSDAGVYRSIHLEKVVPSKFANLVAAVEGLKPCIARFGYLAPLAVMASVFVSPENAQPPYEKSQTVQPVSQNGYSWHTFLENDGKGHSYQMSYGVCEIPLVQGGYAKLNCEPCTEGMNVDDEKIIPIKITSGAEERGFLTPKLFNLD